MNAPLSHCPTPDTMSDYRFQTDPSCKSAMFNDSANAETSALEDDLLVSWGLLHTYGKQITQTNQSGHALTLPTLPERLAHLLLKRSSGDSRGYIFGVSYQAIAEELDTYRETVAAILRAFIRRGFVQIDSQCIQIVDADALLELADDPGL